jgi:hypothetical protein
MGEAGCGMVLFHRLRPLWSESDAPNREETTMSDDTLKSAAECVQTRTGLYDVENIIRREQGAKTLAESLPALLAERDAARADLAAVTARVHDAYLRQPDESKCQDEATGDQLLDRLRGIYTVPVNDGAGPLNGSMTFTRRFPTLPLNLEAAAEIVRLRADLAAAVERNVKLVDGIREFLEYMGDGDPMDAVPLARLRATLGD